MRNNSGAPSWKRLPCRPDAMRSSLAWILRTRPRLLINRGVAYRASVLPDSRRSISEIVLAMDITGIDHAVLGQPNHEIIAANALGYRMLNAAKIRELMRDYRIALRILALAAEARWRTDRHIMAITRLDARSRIAGMKLGIYERLRRQELISRPTFNLPLTQDQIADHLGITMVHISRMLRKLRTAHVPNPAFLVLAQGISAAATPGTSLLLAVDRSDVIFAAELALAVLAVAAGLTIIPLYGLMGAAWTRSALQLAAVAIGTLFLYWRYDFPLPMSGLLKTLIAAALSGISARACLWLMASLPSVILAVFMGVVVYGVAVRLLGALHPADARRIRQLSPGLPAIVRSLCETGLRLLTSQTAASAAKPV